MIMSDGYKWVERFVIQDAILEIGCWNIGGGGGSTRFLSEFAAEKGLKFFSVDYNREHIEKNRSLKNVIFHNMMGEEFLATNQSKFGFVYLDNFDWTYKVIEGSQLQHRQLREYSQYDLELNNINSQKAHRTQSELLLKFVNASCVIVFDDTWCFLDGTFAGKGGTAVPFLIENGFKVKNEVEVAEVETTTSYVVLKR